MVAVLFHESLFGVSGYGGEMGGLSECAGRMQSWWSALGIDSPDLWTGKTVIARSGGHSNPFSGSSAHRQTHAPRLLLWPYTVGRAYLPNLAWLLAIAITSTTMAVLSRHTEPPVASGCLHLLSPYPRVPLPQSQGITSCHL